jgi:hypothetical protein
MLLRMMRSPRAGRPSLLARALTVLIVTGLVGLTAPGLTLYVGRALGWFLGLL